MIANLLNSLGISVNSTEETVAGFIAVLKDKDAKQTEAFKTLQLNQAYYYGLLLMTIQTQYGLDVHPLANAVALQLSSFDDIKATIGSDYQVMKVDGPEASAAFSSFLMSYKPPVKVALKVMGNGSTAWDAVQVVEQIVNFKYEGNLERFISHTMAAWQANLDQGGSNIGEIVKKLTETKTINCVYVLSQLVRQYNRDRLSVEQLKTISAYSDIDSTDRISMNKAAKDLSEKFGNLPPVDNLPPPVPMQPVVKQEPEFAPVPMQPVQDFDEDIDDEAIKAKVDAAFESIKTVPEEVEDERTEDAYWGETALKVLEEETSIIVSSIDETSPADNIIADLEYALSLAVGRKIVPTDDVVRARLIGYMTVALKNLNG